MGKGCLTNCFKQTLAFYLLH
uniref:Uncharacterized protein n=1 Tax=Arundo donax TaxID=35708 RepID=A0A0A9AMW3_ARUDO